MSEALRKRILFVDDEPPVLNLLQTLFRQAHPEWESSFTDRGAKAFTLLEHQPFDVVVSDMRMPEMSGAELLEKVRDHHPRTARIILSGYADQPMSIRSLNAAHQYLSKPFTLASLQSALHRVFRVAGYVQNPILQQALGALHLLPSAPSIHGRFEREVTSPAASADSLGGLIAQDVAMTAKVLQLVHSAFFGTPRRLSLAKESAHALGNNLLRSLAVAHRLIQAPNGPKVGGLDLDALSRHCVSTGLRASRIMSVERATPDAIKLAFTAGVLHGVGRLALAVSFPEKHAEVLQRAASGEVPLLQAETEAFGAHHAQAGAYLLGLWGLPDTLVDTVAHAYLPSATSLRFFTPLTAVHIAHHLESQGLLLPETARPPLDESHLAALQIDQQRILRWAEATKSSSS